MPLSFLTRSGTRSLQFYQLARFGSLFLISFLLARFSGDKILISQYEIFLLVSGTFTFFWVNGILKAFLPYYSQADIGKRKEIIFHNFLLMCLCSFLSSLAIYFTGKLIYPAMNPQHLAGIVAYSFFMAPANFVEYLLFGENKRAHLVTYCIITYLLMILAVVIPVFLGMTLLYSIYALVLLSIFRFTYVLFLIKQHGKVVYSHSIFIELLNYSWPIILITLIGGTADYFDNILVSRFFSGNDFAIFRYGAREFPIVLLLANAISTSFSSHIAEARNKDKLPEELLNLKTETRKLMHIAFPLSILFMIFSTPLFSVLYGESFKDASLIFRVYLLLVVSRVVFPQAVVSGFLLNKMMAVISLIELAVHIFLSILFIKIFGIIGVAYSTVIAFTLEKIVLGILIKKKNNINFLEYIPFGWLIFYSSLLMLVFLLG